MAPATASWVIGLPARQPACLSWPGPACLLWPGESRGLCTAGGRRCAPWAAGDWPSLPTRPLNSLTCYFFLLSSRAAFIDSDEFLVITDGTPDLPTLLEQYRRYGGLVANWRILGSSEWPPLPSCCWGGLGVAAERSGVQGDEGRWSGMCALWSYQQANTLIEG